MAERDVIEMDDLEILASSSVVATPTSPETPTTVDTSKTDSNQDMTSLAAVGGDLEGHINSIEREILQNAMTEYRWNKTAAAKALGVSFRSLRYRLKKLGLED